MGRVPVERDVVMGEFGDVELGDERLDKRLRRIIEKIATAPGDSFPEQMESEAEQEALYRFFANPRVSMDAVLAGHRDKTLGRIGQRPLIRLLHDTSEFTFEGEREGLGIVRGGRSGFMAHFALAVSADDEREPFGVLGVRPFINTHETSGLSIAQKHARSRRTPRAEKKSSRWEGLALEVSELLPQGVEALHIMDMEADDYAVFAALAAEGRRFVIRADPNRHTSDRVPMAAAIAAEPTTLVRDVRLSVRSKRQATKQHPARSERLASLHVRAGAIELNRPRQPNDGVLAEVQLNAVHVFEPSPPTGEPPIDWMLLTTEPIGTAAEVAAIVDHYRARWVIEEYFKALKTGCSVEKRQLCSLDGLLRAVAVFIPMAWMLLTLRTLGRDTKPRDARAILDADQLLLLRALLQKRRRTLPEQPTVRDAMLGIAALGGHIKNNGDPGWLVLARGWRRFAEAEEVWTVMRKYDQS